MSGPTTRPTVGALPDATVPTPFAPVALTWLAWTLFAASTAVLIARVAFDGSWAIAGLVAIDGLTALLWVVVTLLSGIVHSFARRYLAGSVHQTRFFLGVSGFTVAVMALLATEYLGLFWLAWLAMGLLMAELIGLVDGWPQARAAGAVARRAFLGSSGLLAVGLASLWWGTGATTVSGVAAAAGSLTGPAWLLAVAALVLAAMIQSALVPFHRWLLASMTAPTPASALMHAGFVNAAGILLVRFAPVLAIDGSVMLGIVLLGAVSALAGKLLKAVQVDAKSRLSCSTTGQMGFMVMQAGLGFFAAAITHLILHGFYKAYRFLSVGEAIEHTSPSSHGTTGGLGLAGAVVTAVAAVAGGGLFALLTGKGTRLDAGLLLTGLVVLTTLHATQGTLRRAALPARYRYGAVPLVFLPAIAVYGLVYAGVEAILADLPLVTAPTELTAVHGALAAAFLVAYLAIETGWYRQSPRLYVALLNASQAPRETLLTDRGAYRES